MTMTMSQTELCKRLARPGARPSRPGTSEARRGGSDSLTPAFLDTRTGTIYQSCYADGRPAPVHMLDGLPASLLVRRDRGAQTPSVREAVVAGYVRRGYFLTREQAVADDTDTSGQQAIG